MKDEDDDIEAMRLRALLRTAIRDIVAEAKPAGGVAADKLVVPAERVERILRRLIGET